MDDAATGTLPMVVVVTTGGTIAQRRSSERGIAFPAVSGAGLLEALPPLKTPARLKLIDFCNIDSSWMTPADWLKLGHLVKDELRGAAAGLVMTHGTDTMAETAFFLDLVLDGIKPVVLTGAMRLDDEDGADGLSNMAKAVAQVCAPTARDWGVTINMDGCIHAARYARKAHSVGLQSFTSGSAGILGRLRDGLLQRIGDRPRRLRFPLPEALPAVPLLRTYVGDDGALIRAAIDQENAAGLVIEAAGSGNVNPVVAEAIDYVLDQGRPVVVASACEEGGAHPVYGARGGGADLQAQGVILSGGLPGAKARIVLMLALAGMPRPTAELQGYFQ